MQPVVDTPITTPFGRKGNWAAGYHTGNDYACPVGTKVHATKAAKVIDVGFDTSYGNYIMLQSWHRGRRIRHLYAHLSQVFVTEGGEVAGSRVIALSGNTGNSTGPHVHYEERIRPWRYWDHIKPVLPDWKPK